MGGGVDQPGDVINDHQAQGNAPQHQGPTAGTCGGADPEQQQAKGELEPEEVGIQPAVIGIACEIAGETRHRRHGFDRVKHPTHVAPPEAAMTVVMICIRIGKLVVMPVQPHPIDGAVLAAQGPAGGKKPFQPSGQAEGSVREQAVIAKGDAEAGCDPVQHQQAGDRRPAPEARQEGHNREGVDHDHESNRDGMLVIFRAVCRFALAWTMKKPCLSRCQVRSCRPTGRRRSSDRA